MLFVPVVLNDVVVRLLVVEPPLLVFPTYPLDGAPVTTHTRRLTYRSAVVELLLAVVVVTVMFDCALVL
jgi:ABC-type phosphonate transport system ATPase subunit